MTGVNWVMPDMDQAQADAAYRGDWIARKLIDIPAEDATREWRSWQAGDPEEITAIEAEEQRLGLQQKMKVAKQKARLYGGAGIVMGIKGASNETPVDIEAVRVGDLEFLHPVSRWDVSPGPMIDDITSPWYGEPSYYERHSLFNGTLVRFHPSRVVPFVGMPRQDVLTTKQPWGDSVLLNVADAIKSCGLVTASVAQLVAESKIDIIKIPGLTLNISSRTYERNLLERFGLANIIKGVHSMLLIDKEEEWQRQVASFASLPEILQMYFLMVCGAADIPATRFFGQSPAGMSATGESDTRNYYDSVSSKQKNDDSPVLWRLDEVLIRSALGSKPEEIFYVWNSLWQMTPEQKADLEKKKADTFKVDVDAAILDPVVLKKAREAQLIEDGTYPGIEQIIEEFDDPDHEEGLRAEPEPVVDPNADPNAEVDPEDPDADLPEPANSNLDPAKRAANDFRAAQRRRRIKGRDRMRTPSGNAAVRDALADATPKPLYVYRRVLNAQAIIDWAASQGFKSTVTPAEMHVTIMYSKEAVDWIKMGEAWGQDLEGHIRVVPGGPRIVERFGKAVVLAFGNSDLSWRHSSLKHQGCSYDYEDYNPHVTITYNGPEQIDEMEPYRGEIVLGPEVFQEIQMTGFNNETDVPEVALDEYNENQERAENGQFGSGGGGGAAAAAPKVGETTEKGKFAGQVAGLDMYEASDHNRETKVLGKEAPVKLKSYNAYKGNTKVGTVKQVVTNEQRSGGAGGAVASGRGEAVRWRADDKNGKIGNFKTQKDAATALSKRAPKDEQTIHVTVPVTIVNRGGREITTVTKHDEKGRIKEFERITEDEDDSEDEAT